METKGITTSKQILDTKKSELSELGRNELWFKSMLISCFVYGGLDPESYSYNKYILPYRATLGEKVFNEVYEEMVESFSDCEVESNVYTDSEGVTYNSIKYKT